MWRGGMRTLSISKLLSLALEKFASRARRLHDVSLQGSVFGGKISESLK